ncbi:MAG: hypothetical protein A2W05_08495 [Candidatus Schekmanbacteria bacterium RBG_16_38_10]|uniref:Uncharacterized protein n=1 Tax=Candidatus Schekmanbacteria bacterium RBG_16_38_10 TaxID=1817879 RepID=A0A1F7RRE3_9BACT|nr:MAG: hypothetical protein A2W05_08495 [Candidatus Schekmanbacteria bacterium RBG_16_38_10]
MKKTITSPLLSALVFPGAGQIKNRQALKGIIFILLTIILLLIFFYKIYAIIISSVSSPSQINISEDFVSKIETRVYEENTIWVLLLIVVWIAGIADAYLSARNLK